ncbi:hypothetical protein DEU37_0712 [Microbacterium sp. AG790]|nr:hypothetical protein [Microbacterium sp. AG790]RKS93309.1 hypothetical protein DEU37_0712 [Microbacterium sp. AG790]
MTRDQCTFSDPAALRADLCDDTRRGAGRVRGHVIGETPNVEGGIPSP